MNDRSRDDPADGHFGESVASRYDENYERQFAPEFVDPTVDFLADLARGGRALEKPTT